MKLTVNFDHVTGKIRPLHGVGQGPVWNMGDEMFHYLTEAGIPFSRTHDVGSAYGQNRFCDIHNIFRDFDADENDPASYDFAFTDWYIAAVVRSGMKVIYRLGETIENYFRIRAYRIQAPKDPEKWARICEHIIRHYNEGWADGFHYGIDYWEIWNEPEGEKDGLGGACFLGVKDEYFRLYEVTARHLKNVFGDSIRVGGYASCGFGAFREDPELRGIRKDPYDTNNQYWIDYAHDFLAFLSSPEHRAPLDFFSWHSYSQSADITQQALYCRKLLDKYGFSDVEDICDEWNAGIGIDNRRTVSSGARNLAVMLSMQKNTVTSKMCFYDARVTTGNYSGLFDSEHFCPLPSYYAFLAYNHLFELENEVESSAEDARFYVGAAAKDGKKRLLISNLTGAPCETEFDVTGADPAAAEIIMTDKNRLFTMTGIRIKDGKLTVPENSFAEIRF